MAEDPEIVTRRGKLYRLLMRELPRGLYADSGATGTGTDYSTDPETVLTPPAELHARSLWSKAEALALLQLNAEALHRNVTPVMADEEIEAWELFVLARTYPADLLATRVERVKRRLRLRPNLSIPYLRKRLAGVLGYEPYVTTARALEWRIGTSGLGADTNLAGGTETAYIIIVRLSTNEPDSVLEELDELLTEIEPARSTHQIENNTPEIEKWRIGSSSLGTTTNL